MTAPLPDLPNLSRLSPRGRSGQCAPAPNVALIHSEGRILLPAASSSVVL